MVNWIKGLFKSEEQPHEFQTPKNIHVVFVLKFEELVVGYLRVFDGKWQFQYSEEFKKQNQLSPIVDFPDLNKTYDADFLWPFFSHRIPGLGQPMVQHIIKDENLNPDNTVELLKRFGRKSITNPFELAVA